VKRLALFLVLVAVPLLSQSNSGELRLRVTDPSGHGVKTTVHILSQANQVQSTLATDDRGNLDLRQLPFGIYRLEIAQAGFAPLSQELTVRSVFPSRFVVQLKLPAVQQTVSVDSSATLIDPEQAGSVNQIGTEAIQRRLSSVPGRSLQDLVNTQPGWLYEGNAVLHPRGSEYQTQFVVDGIPLTDNRSPSFGNEIEADDIESMSIYTAGIPAEYGRKMGGVVELNTFEDIEPGFHGEVVLAGGSFDTADAFAKGQYSWGRNALGGSASGSMTSHYLNPVVPENYTNTGTLGDFSGYYEINPSEKDRVRFIVRHELARYDIPNEQVQEFPQLLAELGQPAPPPGTPAQLETAGNFETMGVVTYQHIFSPDFLVDVRDMARDNHNDFISNPSSWPIIVFQHNDFKEEYFNSSMTAVKGRHEWKAGAEADNLFLNENYSDTITANPAYASYPFDPGTAPTFAFTGSRPDLEQAAFVQDLMHFGNWTVDAGLRWDHYQLLLNQNAFSPRFSAARNFPSADLIVHASWDRIFQTPSFENILLSSSPQVQSFEPTVLRLPVQPSKGDYYEVGATKSFFRQLRLDANMFRRDVNNYADDDQILNTSISFPISFEKAIIYGAEGKLDIPDWHAFSGFLSYSYQVGNAWFPVTGGLLLGQDAVNATTQLTGHFPDSQDQRNTVRGRIRYQVRPRFWLATGAQFDTGLPFDFDGTPQEALTEYGPAVLSRINFARGRILPSFQVNASAGAGLYKSERMNVQLQADGENLSNVLEVIDFGGLFSGNAIGPSRSYMLRLATTF
jgi:TonB-dependent Receptor Plug Domain